MDFSLPPDLAQLRLRIRDFVDRHCIPAEADPANYDAHENIAEAPLQALRAKLLRMPPLPDERNTLLGRWRVESDGKPKRKEASDG